MTAPPIAAYSSPERRAADRDMILHPERWPQWLLPLKNPLRYNTDNDHAFAILRDAVGDEPITLYFSNLFAARPLTDVETVEYADVDALLDDGWTVD